MIMLWYHPNFRYRMDYSNKYIKFDWNQHGNLLANNCYYLAQLYQSSW